VKSATAGGESGLSIREFFEGARAGRLTVQRCRGCGELAVPPRVVCASCQGLVWERAGLGGEGTVTSFTVIRVPPAGLAAEAPYGVVVVRMSEGVTLLGRTAGIPAAALAETLRVGLPVRFVPSAADPPLLTFTPSG
jgi:uncharacterized OB-fold protein